VHVVVETAPFVAAAKAAGLSRGDVERIVDRCAEHPDAGYVIQGTGGARKIRFAGRGKSKTTLAQLTKVLVDSYRAGAGRLG
jgi:hypothetical protein